MNIYNRTNGVRGQEGTKRKSALEHFNLGGHEKEKTKFKSRCRHDWGDHRENQDEKKGRGGANLRGTREKTEKSIGCWSMWDKDKQSNVICDRRYSHLYPLAPERREKAEKRGMGHE